MGSLTRNVTLMEALRSYDEKRELDKLHVDGAKNVSFSRVSTCYRIPLHEPKYVCTPYILSLSCRSHPSPSQP